MDQVNLINAVVAGALILLGVAAFALLFVAMTIVPQVNRTLTAYEKLGDTLSTELAPTLQEVRKVVVGVGELKLMAGQTMTGVTTKVEDVTGNITRAASTAKHQSDVWGTGFLAGARAFLEQRHDEKREQRQAANDGKDHKPSNNDGKKIAMDRGEENVGIKR